MGRRPEFTRLCDPNCYVRRLSALIRLKTVARRVSEIISSVVPSLCRSGTRATVAAIYAVPYRGVRLSRSVSKAIDPDLNFASLTIGTRSVTRHDRAVAVTFWAVSVHD